MNSSEPPARPKFSFSVASLLASRGIQLAARGRASPSPPSSPNLSHQEDLEDDEEESDISVDDDQDPLQSRLREADEAYRGHSPRGQSPAGSSSPRGASPGGASPPRLVMPTPLLGGRLPFPPHLQGLGLPPGWPGILPPALSGLNPALFKSGKIIKKLGIERNQSCVEFK